MSKNVKIIVFSVVLLICIGIIFFFTYNSNDKNAMPKEEVKELLAKGKEYANVIIEKSSNDSGEEAASSNYKIYKKDNIFAVELDSGKLFVHYNKNTNECISVDMTSKTITYNNKNNIDDILSEMDVLEALSNSDYQYLGEEKIDNRDAVTFRLTHNESKMIYKVDKETGMIVQRIEEGTKINNSKEDHTITWKIQPNKVTDENIKKPDESQYEGYKIIK